MKRAFTLLETVLYIALLSLMMASGIAAAYALMDTHERVKEEVYENWNALFMLYKTEYDTWHYEG